MKFIVALCIVSFVAVSAAPEKRLLLDQLGLTGSPFDFDTLLCDLQKILDVLGAAPAEQQCEVECDKLIKDGHVLNYGCPLICHGFQNFVHVLHIKPGTDDCQGGMPQSMTTMAN